MAQLEAHPSDQNQKYCDDGTISNPKQLSQSGSHLLDEGPGGSGYQLRRCFHVILVLLEINAEWWFVYIKMVVDYWRSVAEVRVFILSFSHSNSRFSARLVSPCIRTPLYAFNNLNYSEVKGFHALYVYTSASRIFYKAKVPNSCWLCYFLKPEKYKHFVHQRCIHICMCICLNCDFVH